MLISPGFTEHPLMQDTQDTAMNKAAMKPVDIMAKLHNYQMSHHHRNEKIKL